MDKRKRFIISSAILTATLITVQLLENQTYKFICIALLGVLLVILFWWSLREGLKSKISFLILVLPLYYSIGSAVFWFLLPKSLWVTTFVSIFYGVSIYALFLTANVYSVSYLKTIALYRAAKGVGFLLTLIAFFLTLDGIISLRLSYLIIGPLVFVLTFPLYLQGFWTTTLESNMNPKAVNMALVASLLQAQVSIVLFFWPVSVIVGSLFLTIFFYIVMGLGQSEIEGRLFSQTVREYLMVGTVVFIVMLLSTSWSGY
ncbi:MAG: hypothetical protein UT39_C0001G0034 [Candidatus Woesebacteria bacterium GW2011_GWA1_39_21]|uniref:Uncharacterized protein n=1 Tax=Candidatus Woesebacteria bacterium GW2011_GWA1_39_21 TaxID=1618550 RepID=A0A0G0N731_9BACT|nr:MAG: hypothetical protein UT39_C0001G0034 [Candidatus Woesebacteria bacterium GW2011_GWA1_39_21]